LATLLFGIEPTDSPTFVVVSATFFVIAMVAALIPALRATRVDPLIALRDE
jgi:ABC-type antimicrobial peptide transport system permease subunit